ncbi:MAG: hypothetical protein HPY83_00690 [Anaerolineae bacterium]|nr:hypothetical protein [Anaerolineae bacterium]
MLAARRRWLLPLAVGLLALASLAFAAAATSADARTLVSARPDLRWNRLAAALALVALNHWAQAGVWHLLTRDLVGDGGWLRDVLRFSVSALTRNLPGAFYWSTASRLLLYRPDGAASGAALAVGVELAIQLCTGAGLALALLVWPWGLLPGAVLVAAPILPPARRGLSRVGASVVRRLGRGTLAERVAALARLPSGTILAMTVTYVAVWLVGGLYLECLGTAIGASLPARPLLYGTWVAASVAGILGSVALGGLGFLREFALAGALSSTAGMVTAGLLSVAARLVLILGTWLCGLATAAACQLLLRQRGET